MAYTKKFREEFLRLLESNQGNIKATIESTGNQISRQTVYSWRDKHEEFRERLEAIKEGWLDNVESALYRGALEGNTTAQIFILKTLGKERGYIEKTEIDHNVKSISERINFSIRTKQIEEAVIVKEDDNRRNQKGT